MRAFLLLFLFPAGLCAQPQPPAFHFVLAGEGEPLRPLERAVHVVQHYRERIPYAGMHATGLKPEATLVLRSGPVFRDSTEAWRWFHPLEGMAESYLMIVAGPDTMRIELPENTTGLTQQAQQRADRDTPEVIRFRTGSHAMEHLMVEAWAMRAAAHLSTRLTAEDVREDERVRAEQLAWQLMHPPAPSTKPVQPVSQLTPEEIMAEITARPGLKRIRLLRVHADTVWVGITGRVMLDGGCASGMPLFGLEMRTDSGWVERHAMRDVQMACGMPWADWSDQEVKLPSLRWWVGANSPADRRVLAPGTYRVVLMGANMALMHTEDFELDP